MAKTKVLQGCRAIIHDPLLASKLKFFDMVSGKVNSFLRGFQTDAPVIPFMADAIGDLVCDFLRRIILKDVRVCTIQFNSVH